MTDAYLEMPSGISGNMILGCLLDAGWTVSQLQQTLDALQLPQTVTPVVQTVQKNGIAACHIDFEPAECRHHRHLDQITDIIQRAALPTPVKVTAIAIFRRLATAEAAAHGCEIQQVHFHEVGALDAIADIVCSVAGCHDLGIDQLYASAIATGSGWVDTAHGRLPVPAPATLRLISDANAPTIPGPGPGELTTPTGAAIVCHLATFGQPPIQLQQVGFGAGTRDYDWPNLARLWLGQPTHRPEPLVLLQANIDDMNPQWYASALDHLFDADVRDAWLVPIQMKKQRPAVCINALVEADRAPQIAAIILRHTTTLGVRRLAVDARYCANRHLRQVETPWGPIDVKIKQLDGQILSATPEYEHCKRIADQYDLPVQQVYTHALQIAGRFTSSPSDEQTTAKTVNNPDATSPSS